MSRACMVVVVTADRHASSDEAEKKQAEVKFKDVGEAYEVLSDAEKRRRYSHPPTRKHTQHAAISCCPCCCHILCLYNPARMWLQRRRGEGGSLEGADSNCGRAGT